VSGFRRGCKRGGGLNYMELARPSEEVIPFKRGQRSPGTINSVESYFNSQKRNPEIFQ